MKKSPAYILIAHVWRHSAYRGGPWSRINSAMQKAVNVAIDAGLTFGKSDFDAMIRDFSGGRWFGADDGEWFYARTISENNVSAAQAYEHYRGREPFIADGVVTYVGIGVSVERARERLSVDSRFDWKGQRVTVTSFAKDGSYLTAVSYKPQPEGSYKHEVDKRFKITVEGIKADRKERKK